MIDRDEAYKETNKVINSRIDKELNTLEMLITEYVSKGCFSLTYTNISESTIDVLKEKGYDVIKHSNQFDGTWYEISWGPKSD